jgi:arabinofuranan 3-O-arabinosyltransferase
MVVGLIGLALVLTVPNAAGWLANDNRFVFYEAPGTQLNGFLQPWNGQIDLGGTPPGFAPLAFSYTALLRALSLPAWLVERIYHATLLALGGVGTALLARRLDRRSPGLPLIAGVVYMTAPFTMSFLIPSWLFQNAVLAPWMVLALLVGTTGRSRWRGPALFAGCVAVAGALNLPGLFWTALPLLPASLYLLAARATTLGRLGGWLVRAGILSTSVLAPAVIRARLGSASLLDNLGTTETVAAVSQSSSWSESLRGLGSWLLYWNPSGDLLFGHLEPYLDTTWVILLTFVPVVAAFAVVGLTTWQPRFLLGGILLVCAAAMVGAYPFANPSPGGSLLVDLYEAAPPLFGLRNTYKAGAGVVMATSILAAYAVVRLTRRLARSSRPKLFVGAFGVLLLCLTIVSAWPLLSEGVYEGRPGTRSIPGYWTDAASWLNAQPDEERVAIYPGSVSSSYEWGTVGGGDIFPAYISRGYLLAGSLSPSSADAANLVRALDQYVGSGSYVEGSYAPIARRLGIGYVILRNDLDWRATRAVRPAALAGLRRDPDLELVATFGEPGENVVRADDSSSAAEQESTLPPVEIYRVRDSAGPVRAVGPGPSLVLSGDGAAWPMLSSRQQLDGNAPVQYSGRLDHEQLLELLEDGSSVTITDTNRRVRSSYGGTSSPLLTADESRANADLFGTAGSQSVAWFGDASTIRALRAPNLINPGVANRPSAAFDGNPSTSWRTGAALPLIGQALDVELVSTAVFDEMTIVPAELRPGDRRVIEVEVRLSNGTVQRVRLGDRAVTIDLGGVQADQFQVAVTAIEGDGPGPFGLAEVAVAGLDIREWVRTPTDLAQAAAADPAVDAALADAPATYLLERSTALGGDDEAALARQFWGLSPTDYTVTGTMNAETAISDLLLTTLLPAPVQSFATGRWQNRLDSSGILATDGDETTAWRTAPAADDRLTVEFPEPVRVLTVVVDVTDFPAPVTLAVEPSDATPVQRTFDPSDDCPPDGGTCVLRAEIELPQEATTVDVSVDSAARPDVPIGVREVSADGAVNPALPDEVAPECRGDLLRFNGDPLPVRLVGTRQQLLDGAPLLFGSCSGVRLTADWNSLESGWELPADRVTVAPESGPGTPEVPALPVEVVTRSNQRLEVDLPDGGESRLISGWAANPSWVASGDARFVELDTHRLGGARGHDERHRIVSLDTRLPGVPRRLCGRPRPHRLPRDPGSEAARLHVRPQACCTPDRLGRHRARPLLRGGQRCRRRCDLSPRRLGDEEATARLAGARHRRDRPARPCSARNRSSSRPFADTRLPHLARGEGSRSRAGTPRCSRTGECDRLGAARPHVPILGFPRGGPAPSTRGEGVTSDRCTRLRPT